MSVTLWVDTASEKTVELGPTLACYAAFAEMSRAAGKSWQSDYGALAGVLTQCESQEDAAPDWLADVRKQAAKLLAEKGKSLSDAAKGILVDLIHDRG